MTLTANLAALDKLGKEDSQIIVVERDKLFLDGHFEGFKHHSEIDFESRILKNLKVMRRGNAEQDPSHKQPIAYALIVNPNTKEIFAYQRASKDEHYYEKRLQGKWSWGVGGHIEHSDLSNVLNSNPIKESMLREIEEEIEILGNKEIEVLGYINDESDDIGKVHFGVVYLLKTDGEVRPKDKELERGKFMTINELKEICNSPDCEVEGWSKIVLNYLDSHFKPVLNEEETYIKREINKINNIFEEHILKSEKINKDLFEHWKKPSWDEYFMSTAILVSMRSIDPSQKNGCVIVNGDKKILSVGYNGFPRGSQDDLIPLTRPEKYSYIEHAEKNAIINRQFDINGSTLYVTAFPCLPCLRSIIQTGVKKVIYIDEIKSRNISVEDGRAIKNLLTGRNDLIFEKFKGDPLKCLYRAIEYYKIKKMSKEKQKGSKDL